MSAASAAALMAAWYFARDLPMPTLSDPAVGLAAVDLLWVVPGWFAFFFVNNALVSSLADSDGRTFRQDFFDDFGYYFVTTLAVLALSPLVVFVAAEPVYLPLLLLPLYAVYVTAAISREKEHQSLHDSLTGLPNRKMILAGLGDSIEDARTTGTSVGFCLLDLDRFKEVNDTLGHHVGDRLLAVVAQRITSALRPSDVVRPARW